MEADGRWGGVIDEERGPTLLESLYQRLPAPLSRHMIAAVAAPFVSAADPPRATPPPDASETKQPESDTGAGRAEAREEAGFSSALREREKDQAGIERKLPPTPPPFSNKPLMQAPTLKCVFSRAHTQPHTCTHVCIRLHPVLRTHAYICSHCYRLLCMI